MIPAPIVSNVPGSFPRHVWEERHPALFDRIRAAHPYPRPLREALDALLAETLSGPMRPLPDGAVWDGWGAPYFGRPWLDAPFLWAESYFYRRLLDAVGYFAPGPWQGVDPFAPMKRAELHDAPVPSLADPAELLLASLWGNRADLSFQIGLAATSGPAGPAAHLVADDSAAALAALDAGPATVCLVADNAGGELLADLLLIDHLLATGRAGRVVLHVKPRPYYVSDATTTDVVDCLHRLPAVVSGRLVEAAAGGRLEIATHWFHCAPFEFTGMPPDLAEEFAAASLVILKGDLNYRRLVGDRHWPAATPFAETVGYFPAPVVALRTLKSDAVVGVATVDGLPDDWRTSGRYALVQARI